MQCLIRHLHNPRSVCWEDLDCGRQPWWKWLDITAVAQASVRRPSQISTVRFLYARRSRKETSLLRLTEGVGGLGVCVFWLGGGGGGRFEGTQGCMVPATVPCNGPSKAGGAKEGKRLSSTRGLALLHMPK